MKNDPQSLDLPVFKTELKHILKIAVPIVIAQVGQMTFGVVDTMMLRGVGTVQQGGVGAATSFFWTTVAVGIGILLGLDTLISQAKGRNEPKECLTYLFQGLWLAATISTIMIPVIIWGANHYEMVGTTSDLLPYIKEYLLTTVWSVPAILLFVVLQRYWQVMESIIPIVVMMILANVIHYFANLLFIYGYDLGLGLVVPEMGAKGVAVATLITRVMLLFALAIFTIFKFRKNGISFAELPWRPRFPKLQNMLRLGLPSGAQIALEVYAFSGTSALSTRLGATSVAAHQIVLTLASFSFMFPMGMSASAAIRVGTLFGAGKPITAKKAGWIAISIASIIMAVSSVTMLVFPSVLLGWFTKDIQVFELSSKVLIFAALFQIFDGIQVSATGALRGMGDTKTAMFANFAGYYLIGLVIGIYLCFYQGLGVVGLWMGLALGLFVVATTLITKWYRWNPAKTVAMQIHR